jgi:streptogramin lyase
MLGDWPQAVRIASRCEMRYESKWRSVMIAVVLVLMLCLGAHLASALAIVPPGDAEEFPASSASAGSGGPVTVLTGPDGSIWYTLRGKLARMSLGGAITGEFTIPAGPGADNGPYGRDPYGLALGSESDLWFTDANYDEEEHCYIGHATSAGSIEEFPITAHYDCPHGIASGPDGDMWFAESGFYGTGVSGAIGRITPAGTITEFPVPISPKVTRFPLPETSAPVDIALGSDGDMWFTDQGSDAEGQNFIGRITPAGVITEFPIPTRGSMPAGIALGPEGDMWFTESGVAEVGRITVAGSISELKVPSAGKALKNIALGPDGNMWFAENTYADALGRITPAGAVTSFAPISRSGGFPSSITIGPEGNVWFTEVEVNKIGRFVLPFSPASVAAPTISGQPLQGQVLSASTGGWRNAPESFEYQWQDCDANGNQCSDLEGQRTTNHYLTVGDVGHTLRVVVSAVNAGGTTTAISAASAVVQPVPVLHAIVPPVEELLPSVDSTMTWDFGRARRYTLVTSLVVRGVPAGAVVEVTCSGHGCAFTRWRSSDAKRHGVCKAARCRGPHATVKSPPVLRGTVNLAELFAGRRLKVGAHIVVSVLKAGWIGKSFAFAIRADRPPHVRIACLSAGSRELAGEC